MKKIKGSQRTSFFNTKKSKGGNMAGNFIPMVYAVLNDKGVDTKDMTTDEAVEKYNEMVGKTGRYDVGTGEKEKPKSIDEQKQLPSIDEDKKAAIQRLVETLKKVKKIKIKELAAMIKNFQPIELHTDSKDILAEFDNFTANKNIYDIGNSNKDGYKYKIANIANIPQMIKDSKYTHSSKETGKTSKQHKNVNEWHYFSNQIETEKGKYNVVVNVRDLGKRQFVYEIAIKRK